MYIDIYDDYLHSIKPKIASKAIKVLMTTFGGKSIRVDSRYTDANGPHEVMLNIEGTVIYTKTMITCDDDLAGQIIGEP